MKYLRCLWIGATCALFLVLFLALLLPLSLRFGPSEAGRALHRMAMALDT